MIKTLDKINSLTARLEKAKEEQKKVAEKVKRLEKELQQSEKEFEEAVISMANLIGEDPETLKEKIKNNKNDELIKEESSEEEEKMAEEVNKELPEDQCDDEDKEDEPIEAINVPASPKSRFGSLAENF